MSRTTLLRSNKTRAVLAATALAGTFLAVGTASAATGTITKVTTQKAPLGVAAVLGIVGTTFDEGIDYVTFTSGSNAACGSAAVQVVSAKQVYVKTPTTGCTAGVQVVKLYVGGASGTLVATGPSLATSTVTFADPPVLATTDPVVPATASILGGNVATATVTTALPATSTVQVVIGGKATPGKVSTTDGTKIVFKVPTGRPGKASIKVLANGFSSALLAATHANAFTYESALKTTPNVWVKDRVAPLVKIDGLNFKPVVASGTTNSTPTVTFCGVEGTVTTTGTKAYTDKVIYVTPPAWSSTFPTNTVSATDGGVCTVKVSVDEDGTGTATTVTESVVTAGSSFTYAAY